MDTQSITVGQVWQEVLTRIESQLSKPSYESFVKAMRPVTLEPDVFVFSVPSAFAKEWLESRYRGLIAETLREILTRGVDVRFIIADTDAGEAQEAPPTARPKPSPARAAYVEAPAFTSKYTFDTFVVGSGNRFAHAACLAVAESPARSYNPLFIYGGVGLGKTHLLQAIGNFVVEQNPQIRVLYISSEKFMNDFIQAIQSGRQQDFRNKYRTVDVLLIDDIQFWEGKEATQEEFFHTFNVLYEAQKQIVATSDSHPKEIKLEERLKNRFEMGLITDIQ